MRFATLAITGALILAGCGPRAGWEGRDIHVVDGYVLSTESRCEAGSSSLCRAADAAAVPTLSEDERGKVSRTSIAALPFGYRDASGFHSTRSLGIAQPTPLVVDFADGIRRVIPLSCVSDIFDGTGKLVSMAVCHLVSPDPVFPIAGASPAAPG